MSKTTNEQMVTVVISRRVKKGCEQQFEALSSEMTTLAIQYEGYLGANLFRPASEQDPEYRIIFKFRDQHCLENWQKAPERLAILEQFTPLLIAPSQTETLSGLVTWFSLPGQNPVTPPPKYKMTLISWLALYPTVTLIFWLFGEQLAQLPLLVRTLVVTGVVIVAMSYLLMPRLTRWFSAWLFPKQKQVR